MAAVDLNNDGFDEVLVGAPLYTFDHRGSPEAGKVTVYLNQQGTLNEQNKIDINGPIKAYARFGHAMTGIGDVNGDQFNGNHFLSTHPSTYRCSGPLPPHSRHCLLYTSPSPRDRQKSRMPSSA